MIKKLKRILIGIGVVGIIIGLVYLQRCPHKQYKVTEQRDYVIEEEIYRQPIVKIPFLAPQLPIAKESLPIPTKEIKKTIEIEVPPSDKTIKVVIIIDKKDKIYKAKDTPKDVVIRTTTWKAKLLEVGFQAGLAVAMQSDSMYFCFSVNVLRVWKIYFGSDIGVASDILNDRYLTGDNFLSGLAVRYKILPKNNMFISMGWNFSQHSPYIGMSLFF